LGEDDDDDEDEENDYKFSFGGARASNGIIQKAPESDAQKGNVGGGKFIQNNDNRNVS